MVEIYNKLDSYYKTLEQVYEGMSSDSDAEEMHFTDVDSAAKTIQSTNSSRHRINSKGGAKSRGNTLEGQTGGSSAGVDVEMDPETGYNYMDSGEPVKKGKEKVGKGHGSNDGKTSSVDSREASYGMIPASGEALIGGGGGFKKGVLRPAQKSQDDSYGVIPASSEVISGGYQATNSAGSKRTNFVDNDNYAMLGK